MGTREMKLAKRVLEVIPPSMAKIRLQMRASSPRDVSVPQFRILGSIFRGRNLIGEMAKHLGVSQPATSKMVDALVEKGFVVRDPRSKDRRQIPLNLTITGNQFYLKIRQLAQVNMSRRIEQMTRAEHLALEKGLDQIEKLFAIGEDRK